MKKTKVFFLIVAIIVLISGVRSFVWAKELNVECQNNSCQPNQRDSFFSLDNLSPGKSYGFKLRFTNHNQDEETIYFSLIPQVGNPQGGIKFTIKDKNLTIYQGYLSKEISLNLGSLKSQQSKDFDFLVQTSSDLDDSWQGKTFNFKSNLEFEVGQIDNTVSSFQNQPTPEVAVQTTPKIAQLKLKKESIDYAKDKKAGLPTNLQLPQVLGVNSNQDILSASTQKLSRLIPQAKMLKIIGLLVLVVITSYFGFKIFLVKRRRNQR